MKRLTYAGLMQQVRDAREITTNGGALAVAVAECPTCGAFPAMRCKAIYNTGGETNAIHKARAHAAADYLSRPLIARQDVNV